MMNDSDSFGVLSAQHNPTSHHVAGRRRRCRVRTLFGRAVRAAAIRLAVETFSRNRAKCAHNFHLHGAFVFHFGHFGCMLCNATLAHRGENEHEDDDDDD